MKLKIEVSRTKDLDNIIIEKLRKKGSLRTQQGDNFHGSITNEESSSIEEPRGLRKKLRHGAKLRLSSSTTSVG